MSALCFDATRRVEKSGDMSPHSKTLPRQLVHGPNTCLKKEGGPIPGTAEFLARHVRRVGLISAHDGLAEAGGDHHSRE
jgi:hypothetical protein